MRIAYFSDAYHPRVSGQVTSMDEFCKSLAGRGHEIIIVCPAYPSERMRSVTAEPFRTIRVPSGSAIVSEDDRLAIPWRERKALSEVDRFDPHVVHIQTEFSIGALGRHYCRRRGLPIVSTCHTYYEMYARWYLPLIPAALIRPIVKTWLRKVYAHDDLIVTPSNHIRDVMRGYGIDREFDVIPTGVDGGLFYPRREEGRAYKEELAERNPARKNGPLLVYVGRICDEKNIGLLIEAMAIIVNEIPSAHLLFVGDGPRKIDFQHAAARRGLAKNVTWAGFLPRERLPIVYSAADLFLFPSKTETQGLVTIEAMLCGTPVVGVNRMGTAELMRRNAGGLLADDDPKDFAQKALSLLRDPGFKARKAAEALRHGQSWTIEKSCDKMERLYADYAAKCDKISGSLGSAERRNLSGRGRRDFLE